jgi:uncharacterized repeat protein (TIGR01451 family)
MGNGRRSGQTQTKISTNSGTGSLWVRALGAMVVLLVAGSILLGLGSGRKAEKAMAANPASPIPAFSRSSSRSSLSSPQSKPEARAILGQLPLIFEPNQGQADPQAKFLAHGTGYNLFLDATVAVLGMQTAHTSPAGRTERFVAMKLVGANPAAVLAGTNPFPGKSNYLIGNDPQKWHTGVPQFAGVHYAGVYPGIDLIFYGNQGQLEYDFQVAPGADPSRVELQFDGANQLKLSGGDLILTSDDEGGLHLQAPKVYQRDGDRRVPVAGRFVLRSGKRVGFEIGAYDRSRELIVDPGLTFSTYFGGSGSDTSPSVAVNGNGNIYIAGTTTSPQSSFPDFVATDVSIPSTLTITPAGPSHIFVAEIIPSQPPAVAYETFIGGTGTDTSIGLGVDNGGNAYLVGNTSSTDFPTNQTSVTGYQQSPEPKTQCTASPTCTSIFASVLNSAGTTLTYSSYLSGNGDDQASGMAIDAQGDLFVTGTTTSNQATQPPTDAFPATQVPQPYQSLPQPGSTIQFFVTKLSTTTPSTRGVAYSTYFGGTDNSGGTTAIGGGVAVDPTGNIYFSGTTNFYNSGAGPYGDSGQSEDFPILNAYQPCLDTPPPTILTNPNPCSSTGLTSPFPTDAFVAKLNPNAVAGTQLLFSTYFGGGGTDSGTGIAIDSGAANIYLTGSTNSPMGPAAGGFNLPTGISPFQLCLNNPGVNLPPCPAVTGTPVPSDAYVVRFSNPTVSTSGVPNDVVLEYFSYLGGGGNDSGAAIAVLDSLSTTLNDVVITGSTSSGIVTGTTNFPTTIGAIQSQLNGPQNAFLAQIDTTTIVNQGQVGSFSTYFGGNGTDHGTGVAVDPNLNTYLVGDTNSNNGTLEVRDPLQAALATGATRNAFVVELGTQADLCITCVAPILSETGTVSAGNQLTVTFTVANNGPDPATTVIVTGAVPPGVTLNSATAGSGTCSAPSSGQVVCQIPTLQAGASSLVAFSVTPLNACNSCSVTAAVSSSNNTGTINSASASFTAGAYALQISPPAQTTPAGLTAQYSVNLSPTQGVFGSNISLSCSALPTGATCAFTSSSLNLGNGNQSVTLNLTTTAQPETTITSDPWTRPLYAFWLMIPGMAMLGVGAGGKRRQKKMSRLRGLFALSMLFALVLLQPSCSSTKTQPTVSGTPSGTYSLTVTATSGSFTRTAPFSLTVIP